MEVPGKRKDKATSEKGSRYCEPCDGNDETSVAENYCIDCNEFLCDGCARVHRKSRMSRNHELLEGDNMPKRKFVLSSDNTCSRHVGKAFIYYCYHHNGICCASCATLDHRSCWLEHLTEKAEGFENGEDYRALTERIQKVKQRIYGIKDKILICQDRARSKHLNFMEEIQEFCNNIETIIEVVVDKATEKAKVIQSRDVEELNSFSTRSDEMAVDIDEMVEELDLFSLWKRNSLLCIATKQAEAKIDTVETKLVDIETKTKVRRYSFRGGELMKENIETWSSLKLLEFADEQTSSDEVIEDESKNGLEDDQKKANYHNAESGTKSTIDFALTGGGTAGFKPVNECKTDTSIYESIYESIDDHRQADYFPTISVTKGKPDFVQDAGATACFEQVNRDITSGFACETDELFEKSSPVRADRTRKITGLKKIYIRHKQDANSSRCLISGMIKLTHSRLLLTDHNNHSLKIVDVAYHNVVSYLKLTCRPWDLTLVGNDRVVVSCSDRLIFFRYDQDLIKTKEVDIKGQCTGVASQGTALFVTFISPRPCLKILNMEGVVLRTIPKSSRTNMFSRPNFVIPCSEGKEVIVSDGKQGLLTIQQDGRTNPSSEGILQNPFGMTPGRTGTIFVAGKDSNNVIEISETPQEQRKISMRIILTEITKPLALVYSKTLERLYISHGRVVSDTNDYLSVFQL